MDFEEWVKVSKLSPDIVGRLNEEDFNDLDMLKDCSDEDISSLNLSPEQHSEFTHALKRLRQKKDIEENGNVFDSWAGSKKLKRETVDKLKSAGLDNLDKLRQVEEATLKGLQIKAGQLVTLKKAIFELQAQQSVFLDRPPAYTPTSEPLPENDFVKFLRDKQVKDTTIQKLIQNEYDSPETLQLVVTGDLDNLAISVGQYRLLSAIIEELKKNSTPKKENMSYDEAFRTFLTEMKLDQTTVKKLVANGFETLESLTFLRKEDIDKMDLPARQRSLIEVVLKELHRIDEEEPAANLQVTNSENLQTEPGTVLKDGTSTDEMPEQKKATVGGFRLAWSTFKKQTVNSVKSGIGNFYTYLSSMGEKSESCHLEPINGMRIMKLPLRNVYEERSSKVRKCIIGKSNLKDNQKTIMVVGATGAGKSTLIDGICNYIFGTKWEEKHRFKLIDEHSEEKANLAKGQAQSQTEWITVYTITSGESNRLPYTLNLIDTPGFGDTRGIQRDNMIVDQIKALFENKGKHEIDSLDAVCFIAKAPDARLTHTQRYIFDSILSIFGRNIADNILVMITFADGARAPVLDAIKAAKLPHKKAFPFNNSALFANNGSTSVSTDIDSADQSSDATSSGELSTFAKMFWTMGEDSFKGFFSFLATMESKSLSLTKEVLEKRRNLRDTLTYLEEKLRIGLATMSVLKEEHRLFLQNKQRIEDNKDFEYTTTKHYSEKFTCDPGIHVTHCMHCHNTCHNRCAYKDNEEKANCCVMDERGSCTICKLKCHWTQHKNTGYYLVHKSEEIKQTWKNKLKEYEQATDIVGSKLNIIEMTKAKYLQLQHDVQDYVKRCRDTLQRLREIALKPDPLSEVEYIELLIRSEQDEHKPGWEARVNELRNIKSKAQTIHKVNAEKALMEELEHGAYT